MKQRPLEEHMITDLLKDLTEELDEAEMINFSAFLFAVTAPSKGGIFSVLQDRDLYDTYRTTLSQSASGNTFVSIISDMAFRVRLTEPALATVPIDAFITLATNADPNAPQGWFKSASWKRAKALQEELNTDLFMLGLLLLAYMPRTAVLDFIEEE